MANVGSISRRVRLGAGAGLLVLGLWGATDQWATWLALNDTEPPLRGLPGGGARQLAAPPTRVAARLVIVIVDGLNASIAEGLPNIAELAREGIWATATAAGPTYSAPAYTTWLTGLDPSDSGVRTNRFPIEVPLDSLPARARGAGLRTLSYESGPTPLGPLFGRHFARRLGPGTPWVRLLAALERAELAVVILDDADAAGHAGGARGDGYARAAVALDRKVGSLAATMRFDRDLLVVLNDHGHLPEGGHGGLEAPVAALFVAARGAGLARGARAAIAARDLAPTLAVLLGLRPPAHNRGWLMGWALDGGNEPGFLQGAFANQYLARLRVERYLARQLGAALPSGRGIGAGDLLRARVGGLAQARRLARGLVDRAAASVDRASGRRLAGRRWSSALVCGALWLVCAVGLGMAWRRSWLRSGPAGWLLPLCTVLGGYGALRLLGLRPSLSFNGIGWMVRFFAAALVGVACHLMALALVSPTARGGDSSRLPGRLLAGALVLAGLAVAATASAPIASGLALPDLRLVASMFLIRLWAITFFLGAGVWLLVAGLRTPAPRDD